MYSIYNIIGFLQSSLSLSDFIRSFSFSNLYAHDLHIDLATEMATCHIQIKMPEAKLPTVVFKHNALPRLFIREAVISIKM